MPPIGSPAHRRLQQRDEVPGSRRGSRTGDHRRRPRGRWRWERSTSTGADIAIAVTGAGGPGPEEGQPAGTVYLACGTREARV